MWASLSNNNQDGILVIYLLIVSIFWGFSFSLIKSNLTAIDPILVACARLLLSLLVFLPFLRLRSLKRSLVIRLIVTGMFQYGIMYMAYIYSFRFLRAYEVALFTIFTPLYVTLIHDSLQKKFSYLNLFTALLAVAGTAIVEYQDIFQGEILLGFIIVQISNLGFAFGQIYYKESLKEYPEVKDHQIFGLLYLGAFGITAISAVFFSDLSTIKISQEQLSTLIYLGVVASGICFFIWNYGARRVNTGALAIFNNLKVPLAVVISLVIFHESTNVLNLLAGGSIVVLGLGINEFVVNKLKRQSAAIK